MTTIHYIKPERNTLHGPFDRDLPPAITINSGDTVRLSTLDAGWGIEKRKVHGGPRKKFPEFNRERDGGHSLIGPIEIVSADPGMVLEIKINDIIPGDHGWVSAGGFPSYWNKRLGLESEQEFHMDFLLDREKLIGKSQFGTFPHQVKLRPFMGIMGMPPNEPGKHSTVVPRFCGGNIDCKELVPGSTLYLPIPVKGGLLSIGDGHAVQGDGEVAGPALECPMDLVDLTITVRSDMVLKMPRAKTPIGWITFGVHEDLDEAVYIALEQMLDLIMEQYGMSRTEAYAWASMVVEMRITQIVNSHKGAHAILPFGAIR
jgi:acetamidase/formamidase